MKSYASRLSIIHKAISASAVTVTGVLFFLAGQNGASALPVNWDNNPMIYLLIAALLFPAVTYTVIVKKQISQAQASPTLDTKMKRYQVALLLLWASIEGGVMISAVAAFISKNTWFFVPAVLLIGILVIASPSKSKIQNDLSLSQEEMAAL